MLEKIRKYSIKVKGYYNRLFKTSKIKQYKNINKIGKLWWKEERNRGRNKYSIQLKINFKWSKFKKFTFILVLIILITLTFFIKGPFFKIENINVIKLDENVNSRLIEKKINNLKWKLLFYIKEKEIIWIIKEIEQNIEKVKITKIPPSTINIRLSSFKPIYKTSLNKNKYLITENWVFLPTKSKNSKYKDIVIKELELESYPNYKKILDTKNLNGIKYLGNSLESNIVNLKINNIIYYKTSREVHFIINNKTRIIFDLEWNLDEKLKQIFVFNKEKVDITIPGIIYIDNRIKSKILYCPTSEVEQCIKNINYIYNENIKK
jgi:cell division septal protein FtsQ